MKNATIKFLLPNAFPIPKIGGGPIDLRSMDHLVAYTFYAQNLLSRMI